MIVCCVLAAAVVVLSLLLLYTNGGKLLMTMFRMMRPPHNPDYPKDQLVLFQFPRSPMLPSISPYCLKMETFLRAAKIPYVNNLNSIFSKKGKCPWVMHRGRQIADSQLVIETLTTEMGADLDKHLSDEQKAAARLVQKFCDEYLVAIVGHFRYSTDRARVPEVFSYRFPPLFCSLFASSVRDRLWAQGVGRHSEREIQEWGRADLRALSTIMGSKDFLFGSEPSVADCSLFGLLCQMLYTFPKDSPYASVFDECANLRRFVERMRERYWPDWQEMTDKAAEELKKRK